MSSKFELLNGWRMPRPYEHLRTAYKRARWFLKKPSDKNIAVSNKSNREFDSG